MDRRTFLAGASGVATVGLAGCARLGITEPDDSGGDDADHDVGMGASFFRPAEITVEAGTTVVFQNTGNRRHTVTAYESGIPEDAEFFASGGFDTEQAAREGWMAGFEGRIESGEVYEHTFEVPGEYQYFCIPHEPSGMVGTVVVTE
ncbi:plastocyanin/azurin family copper-binding protein [Halorussus marinus]|uniref:plastocyanin/azurin family copper-binding protein n=1 Tax=Halorussus marinus TaxID=2505976 RepID=UPI0010920451|nr:plastocyanin/azurin family copper-binding protein [Halorussus marinus]